MGGLFCFHGHSSLPYQQAAVGLKLYRPGALAHQLLVKFGVLKIVGVVPGQPHHCHDAWQHVCCQALCSCACQAERALLLVLAAASAGCMPFVSSTEL